MINAASAKDSNLIEEENKKMYTALLQNQVLGIDNPFLLHEIHNADENHTKTNLYTQQQRITHHDEQHQSESETRRNTLLSGCGLSNDSSPFNSKFTVLKFNSPQVQLGKFSSGLMSQDSYGNRGIFSNASNYSFSQSSDIFSQAASNYTNMSALSENMNPLISSSAFKHNPICGFDED